jgi:hypothetical protein
VTVIRLSELGQAQDGSLGVRVSFGDEAEYDVRVADPADPSDEANLAWYFEEHLRYPFLDKDRERAVMRQIAVYGEALFGQIFGGRASYDYRKLRDRSFDGCRLEVSGSAALHRLHWESLRDPDLSTPLAVRLPVTRRVSGQPSKFELPSPQPTLNILVVTARPDGPRDVGYRTISRPLLDALRTADLQVTADLVRPGTWESLLTHLRLATKQHGSGWYQVVHFDLHGAFSEYSVLEEGRQAERLIFSSGQLVPFEGKRGFLFFETPQAGQAEPVPAEAVASLLAEHRVPVAVLNACQSAMQSASEASLAQRLAEAGVPVTVGMAYSVTVSAAVQAMPVLYEELAAGTDLTTAVRSARLKLYEHRERHAYFDQQLELEDWMLPVMFGQRPLQLQLRPMTGDEQATFYEHSASVGDEPSSRYGFVGRDLDIQAIERMVLASPESNELLVRAMAGAGKSTLLKHLAWWWQRTGLVEESFRFSYEDRAWTCGQIIREIRSRLFSPADHARADSMPDAAQLEQIAQYLRSHRHLLILDNAESITSAPASIPHALDVDEQQTLKTLLARLRGGRTVVLLGSREPETWLTSGGSGPGVYMLPGLDPQAASVLVDRILRGHGATHYLEDEAERTALDNLVTLLGGYPLPLTVVLPALAATTPSEILAELGTGGPGADPADLIHRAIEYSHDKLDPALQTSLALLAPFASVIVSGPALDLYQELVLQNEATQPLHPVDLAAALDQAINLGLATPHPHLSNTMQVQPLLPYFLRSRLHDRPAVRATADQAHYEVCLYLAETFASMLSSDKSPGQRVSGQTAIREYYANLTAAVGHGLRTGQPVSSLQRSTSTWIRSSNMTHAASFSTTPSPHIEPLRARPNCRSFPRCMILPAWPHLPSVAWTMRPPTTKQHSICCKLSASLRPKVASTIG